jgi:hypothetical protein
MRRIYFVLASILCLILWVPTVLAQSSGFAAQPLHLAAPSVASFSESAGTVRKVIAEVRADVQSKSNIDIRVTDEFTTRVTELLARVKIGSEQRTIKFRLFFTHLVEFTQGRSARSSPQVESLKSIVSHGEDKICSTIDLDSLSNVQSRASQGVRSADVEHDFTTILGSPIDFQPSALGVMPRGIVGSSTSDGRVIKIGVPELLTYLDEGHCGESPCKMECNPCDDRCDSC